LTNKEFVLILQGAVAGKHDDLSAILEAYDPLIRKYATIKGKFNEDLHQYLLIHIALNINKFPL